MRNPLIHQSTNYDCGPTTLINALRFLYTREELDPALIVGVYARTLDEGDASGAVGKGGTSYHAMRRVAAFFNDYGKKTGFPIATRIVNGEDAYVVEGSPVIRSLRSGSVAIARVWHGRAGHYILLTGIGDDGRVLAFDPYQGLEDVDGTRIQAILNEPHRANRSVDPAVFNTNERNYYALKNDRNADPDDPSVGEFVIIGRAHTA